MNPPQDASPTAGVAANPAPDAKRLDLLALGEAMVEFNQRPGADGHWLAGFGGDTSNCAIAAARMGAATGYLTQVGDDLFGDQLIALWQQEGVDISGTWREPGGATGLYFVTHGPQGHGFHYRRAGSAASRMTAQLLAGGQVEQARWLHCSGISQAISAGARDTVAQAVARAGASGTRISYDLNFRPPLWGAEQALAGAREVLAHADLFLPSIDEVQALAGWSAPQDVIRWSHDQGARQVALKLGAAGAWVSDGREITLLPPHPVQPVDATGAGDCFAGALLARLAAGDTLVQAAQAATIAAALSTQGRGAVAPLPRWAAVRALMPAQTPKAGGEGA